jgi:hypothetical protein
MPESLAGRRSWGLAFLGLTPAAVLVVVILLQGHQLTSGHTPPVCVGTAGAAAGLASKLARCVTAVRSHLASIAHSETVALEYGWIGAALLALIGLAAGASALIALGEFTRRARDARRGRGPVEASDVVSRARTSDDARDRERLVASCLDLADLSQSAALRERVLDALADVGVTPVQARRGEPFDPARHHAVGRTPTADARRHNRISDVQREGYTDRGHPLRYPDVLVFQADTQSAHEARADHTTTGGFA